jgi:hypothetical protein
MLQEAWRTFEKAVRQKELLRIIVLRAVLLRTIVLRTSLWRSSRLLLSCPKLRLRCGSMLRRCSELWLRSMRCRSLLQSMQEAWWTAEEAVLA